MKNLINLQLCLLLLFFSSVSPAQISPLPENCRQMIIVLTDSVKSTKGYLSRFERKSSNSSWEIIGRAIPVVLGRNGLAWGRGLNPIDSSKLPVKIEGDGKSPAGIFTLSAAFGYAPGEKMGNLKIPYIHITEMLECIDDPESESYNKLVDKNKAEEIDWTSSERMYFGEIWYEMGVVVDHNADPVISNSGSCIFLHNWSTPDETSAGCTEMDPVNMKEIILWLDQSFHPVLVQLTKQIYFDYQGEWGLPDRILSQ